MTSSHRRKLLVGYLLFAVAGIAMYPLLRHRLGALVPATPVAGEQLSWSHLPGIAVFMVLLALTVFFSLPTNPLFYLAAGYLYGRCTCRRQRDIV